MSQAESFMPHLGEIFLEHQMTGRPRQRQGNRHPRMAPHGVYPCIGEDRWVAIAVRNDREWEAFCDVAAMPELGRDARLSTVDGRVEDRDELDAVVSRWTATRDRYDVTELLQARGIPAGPVLDCCGDAYDDPHLQARSFFQEVTHPARTCSAGLYGGSPAPPSRLTGPHRVSASTTGTCSATSWATQRPTSNVSRATTS